MHPHRNESIDFKSEIVQGWRAVLKHFYHSVYGWSFRKSNTEQIRQHKPLLSSRFLANVLNDVRIRTHTIDHSPVKKERKKSRNRTNAINNNEFINLFVTELAVAVPNSGE